MAEGDSPWPALIASGTTVIGTVFFEFLLALTDTRNLSDSRRESITMTSYIKDDVDPPRFTYFMFGVGTVSSGLLLLGVGLGLLLVEPVVLVGLFGMLAYWVVVVYGYLQIR